MIEEFDKLTRDCSYLVEASDIEVSPVGKWDGEAIVSPPSPEWKHWCSIDASLLQFPGIHLAGWLSVFRKRGRVDWCAVLDRSAQNVNVSDGIPLKAIHGKAKAPLQAILLYGNDVVQSWLNEGQIYDEDTLLKTDEGKEWERLFRESCPLYRESEIVAQIGGWHIEWPDSQSYDEHGSQILVWTFRDAEPWVELWMEDGVIVAVPRVT